ncbi:MAG: methyltransferase domain-containing protein [Candidatus Dormibacteraeota bacterium]|uniref:Methyltransferase domain-containing protein n=1 Tax=Candidatus Aeolococcus gillhamiae TaxID=3127015 RepID=A0A934JZI1_9BACT|nr:methyltransferase domain-containing protein [Candidatus Dormibacteraeota bacterium]
MTNAERIASYYTATATAYRDLWVPLLRPAGLRLLEELPLGEARQVVDVGTGVGTLLPHLRKAAPRAVIIGVDPAAGMLALAPRDFPLVVADVTNLPLIAGACDVAVLAFMLFHVSDPVAALREVRRVLAADGAIGLTTWGSAGSFPAEDIWNEELDAHGAPPDPAQSTYAVMDTPEKVTGLLASAGFRTLSLHLEPWRQIMTPDQVVALRTSIGAPARRLAALDPEIREVCVSRARERLLGLDEAALTDRDDVIYATATPN